MTITRVKQGNFWIARGWDPVSITPVPPDDPVRDSLVYGTYEPDASTTGILPNSTLTAYNSPSVNSFTLPSSLGAPQLALGWYAYSGVNGAGMALSNKIVYGDMVPPAAQTVPIYLLNCLLVGGANTLTQDGAVLDCSSSGRTNTTTAKVTLIDCEIAPRQPSNGRDGVKGRMVDVFRCNIHNTNDGIGIFAKTQQGTVNANVTAMGNWIHNLGYGYPDTITPSHTDGTHNDCIQHQGGRNVWIKGNALYGTTTPADVYAGSGANPAKPWLLAQGMNNGQVLIVQNNTGQGIDNTTVIEDNYFYGGFQQLTVFPNIQLIFRNNHHYRKVGQCSGCGGTQPTSSGYWIRFNDHTSEVEGLNQGTNNNRFIDGPYAGAVLVEPRDRGIDYIA